MQNFSVEPTGAAYFLSNVWAGAIVRGFVATLDPAPAAHLHVRPQSRVYELDNERTAMVGKLVGGSGWFSVAFLVPLDPASWSIAFAAWRYDWRNFSAFAFPGLVTPLYYLIALRGLLNERHNKLRGLSLSQEPFKPSEELVASVADLE